MNQTDAALARDDAMPPASMSFAIERDRALLARIVDGEERSSEWGDFIVAADGTPALWRELACSQRDARLLADAVAARIDRGADGAFECLLADASRRHAGPRLRGSAAPGRRDDLPRLDSPSSGGRLGWVLAACVAAAWVVSAGLGSRRETAPGLASGPGGASAAPGPSAAPGMVRASIVTPSDALDEYLRLGKASGAVVGELPGKPVIERRALEGGEGFEVVFVRQIIEVSRVPALYKFDTSDEFGAIVPVPVRPDAHSRGASDGRGSL